ncbi:MAG: CoA transferase [Deltaproteobacteria bacterium]|nr:CoA transferase [Deltaproteobacteria bacterium]
MAQALDGIRILDLSNYIAGPFAAMLLADMGAAVVRVENTNGGDPFRKWSGEPRMYSPLFRSYNRNKRAMTLNLRHAEGKEIFLRMVEDADIVIENYRPGVMERLELGYERLSKLNPRLIYCGISAFGQTGPYREKPGFDTLGQCLSGLLSQIIDPQQPQPPGLAFSDHLGGLFACYGILTALMAREKTGRGQKVETSLMEASMAFIGRSITQYFATGDIPNVESRGRSAGVYALLAGDGLPFVVHLSHLNKFFVGLTHAIERPELADDPRFREHQDRLANYDDLKALLQETVGAKPRAHWLEALTRNDVANAPINRLDEVFNDPQVQHLDRIMELRHPKHGTMHTVRSGVNLSETPANEAGLPPELGEHNTEVLRELGFDEKDIARLAEAGTI